MAGKMLHITLVISQLVCLGWGLKIMSFNIKDFGEQRFAQQNVTNVIVKLIADYDISLLLEVMDSHGDVVPGLQKQVNNVSTSGSYSYYASESLGSSNHKEKYVFFYRTKTIEVLADYQYENDAVDGDTFERPPYALLVQSRTEDIPKFFLLGIHTKPSDAKEEINELGGVFLDGAAKAFSTSVGMILGDLNCGCEYVSHSAFSSLQLFQDTNFTWWIDNSADTTTSPNTNCPYDRIITYKDLSPNVVKGSGKVVRFDEMFGLTSDETQSVSDHYPVEISLSG